MTGRRILSVVAAAATTLVLAACSGLPTSGPVNAGPQAGDDQESFDFRLLPNSPQAGMTPQQIVQGFIAAGTSPEDDWAIANLYLAPELGEIWRPEAGVTIDAGIRTAEEVGENAVDVTVTPSASVDETGAYAVSDAGATVLSFRLAQRADGEWRITEAPDGIVLERDFFVSVFRPYPIVYFDPGFEFLVPDLRWFPFRNNPATRIARALVNEPRSPWLAESVATGFPEGVSLARLSVTVDANRVAGVELDETALGLEPTVLGRMRTQLEASLTAAGVESVQMSVGGTVLEAPVERTSSTRVAASPLVLTEAGFGFLAGEELAPIPGLSAAVADYARTVALRAIEVSVGGADAAVRTDAAIVRVRADGEVLEVDARPGLIDPSIDPQGWIWSVGEDDPTAVRVSGPEGAPAVVVADAWPDASQIAALRVSRDGTRVAALLTVGGQHRAVVAGIVRGEAGVPLRLGQTVEIARLPGPGIAAGWLDDTTVGLAFADGDGAVISEQVVGGDGTRGDGPLGVTTIAGQGPVVRLRDAEGVLFVERGSNWGQAASGILVLATQQGAPQ